MLCLRPKARRGGGLPHRSGPQWTPEISPQRHLGNGPRNGRVWRCSAGPQVRRWSGDPRHIVASPRTTFVVWELASDARCQPAHQRSQLPPRGLRPNRRCLHFGPEVLTEVLAFQQIKVSSLYRFVTDVRTETCWADAVVGEEFLGLRDSRRGNGCRGK